MQESLVISTTRETRDFILIENYQL